MMASWIDLRTRAPRTRLSIGLLAVGIALMAVLPGPWLIAGAIPAFAGAAMRPWLTIPAVVLLLPYHLHPRSIGGLEVALSEATLLLGGAATLLRAILERRTDGLADHNGSMLAVRLPVASLMDIAAAAMLLAALLSLLVTEYPKQSLRELRWLIVEPIAVFYLCRATYVARGQVTATLWAIAASGAIAAVVSLGALMVHGSLTDLGARGTEPFLSPNHLGLFLGRASAVALALLLFGEGDGTRQRAGRWPAALSLAVIAAGIARSISLGAWAALAAVVLALTALHSRKLAMVAGLAIVVLGLGALVILPADRVRARLDPEVGTGQSRLYVWAASVRMIEDHPILGVGLDNFLYAYRTTYIAPEAWREPNLSHPHNWILHFWLQLGILGLLSATALMAWAAWRCHVVFHHPSQPGDRALRAAVGGMLLAFVVHGSLDNSYFLVDAATLWWVGMALIAARDVSASQ